MKRAVLKLSTAILVTVGLSLVFTVCNDALAATRTFPAGSYIIPLEPCWQPNNDPRVSLTPAYCDTHKDDKGVFHAYGMVYDLLNIKVPVYWTINPGKDERNGIDFSVVKSGAGPAVQVLHSSALASSGTLPQADYRGGPFVIDANDLTPEVKAAAENIIRNVYKSTKVHVANYDFSAPVDKVLSDTPPRVAVLGEGATQVLLDYLKATGLGDRVYSIFRSITARDIISGVLNDFQLLWAPHWILENEIKVQADRDKVLSAVRGFLEKGNAGFFGCAFVESIEGSIHLDGKTLKTTGPESQNSGGFLTDRTYTTPRIDSGGGSMNMTKIVFENPALSLDQCAGWNFVPHEGHMQNLRPRKDNTTSYTQSTVPYMYNSSVARFIHDRDDFLYKAPTPTGPPGYDYFAGGRINGSATQGYAVYLAGHRHILCLNAGLSVPTERRFDLYFDRDISAAGYPIVTVETVHLGCRRGIDCPRLSYDISNPLEDISNDGKLYVQTEGMVYDSALRRLSVLTVGNLTGANLTITELIVTFPTNLLPPDPGKQASLTKIIDSTDSGVPVTLCAPNAASPAVCAPPALITLGPPVNSCNVDWTKSNTCGIRYVLNTLLGLQFHLVPDEYNRTSPVVDEDVLYKGTFEYPGYKGHLYGINVMDKTILWDAGAVMPFAGTANPTTPARTNDARYVFTNVPGTNTMVNFEAGKADMLRPFLDPAGTKTMDWARILINSVRGKKEASDANPVGAGNIRKRLGGVEHSTPAVFQRSQVIRDARSNIMNRDRVVFVGADDGMLHAFYSGSWDGAMNGGKGGYTHGTGREIWAYIPSSLLASLQNQTLTDCSPDYVAGCDPVTDVHKCACPLFSPAVAVDGSPAIGDFFMDDDNDTRTPSLWKTVLVGTAVVLTPQSRQSFNQGVVFALDVTDPYDPKILWERTYPNTVDAAALKIERNYYPVAADYNGGYFPASYRSADNWLFDINMGNSKGGAIGRVRLGAGTRMNTLIFLTSNWIRQVNTGTAAAPHKVWGLGAYALDLKTGDIVWETKILYTGDSEGINEPPPIPALMDVDDTGTQDYVVFGDMQGRLWILRASDGRSLTGDSPAFVVKDSAGLPMGAREPIGASVSVYRNYIVFGTGGRDSLTGEDVTPYHVYALQVTPEGVKSLWKDPASGRETPITLNPGEKVWSPPIMDGGGNIYIATGQGYSDIGRPDLVRNNSKGRFVLVDRTSGAIQGSPISLPGGIVGGIDVENKHAYVVTFDGTVVQIGGNDFTPSNAEGNPLKILWWKRL